MNDGGRMEATTTYRRRREVRHQSGHRSRHRDDLRRARSGCVISASEAISKRLGGAAGGPGIHTFPDNRGSDAAILERGGLKAGRDFGWPMPERYNPGTEHTLEKVNASWESRQSGPRSRAPFMRQSSCGCQGAAHIRTPRPPKSSKTSETSHRHRQRVRPDIESWAWT